MKGRLATHLFSLLVCSSLLACGIDDYIYLDPVTDTDWNFQNQKIVCTFPTSQTDGYFQNYVIYYRLYPSTVNKSGNTVKPSDFSAISSAMYSDYLSIYPYSTDDDEAPVNLQSLLENSLAYKELALGQAVISKDELGTVIEVDAENLFGDTSHGKTITIDFNLPSLETAHPSLIINETKHRLLREDETTTLPSRDFLQAASMSGGDFEGTSQTFVYAMFYIVAKGIDESFSTLLSRAAFLGALQLPEPTT